MDIATHPFQETVWAGLPQAFSAAAEISPAPAPEWVVFNAALADELGLRDGATPQLLTLLSGGEPPEGRKNLALAYAGHQFGQWNPRMGDGRAVLVGEIHAADGGVFDVHLKGSGPTAFAWRGDGRATLSSMLREYIVSEAMAGLGIPTTRSLAVVATGAPVFREAFAHRGAVLTRIARSHVRVGTFQYAAEADARRGQGPELLRALADHCIARLYPELAKAENPHLQLFATVVERQARLIAQWMLIGFIHGVMNTDNMAISCETIDFGPCAFMDAFSSEKVFSSIDVSGRYAYKRQPAVGMWNLARLAEAMLPLFDADEDAALRKAQQTLETFRPIHAEALDEGAARKLGLLPGDPAGAALIERLWPLLDAAGPDFTLFFRRLTDVLAGAADDGLLALVAGAPAEARQAVSAFLGDWRQAVSTGDREARLSRMRAANPVIIARNHRVQQALQSAVAGDLAPLERLCAALRSPFAPGEGCEDLEVPPSPEELVTETFCGT